MSHDYDDRMIAAQKNIEGIFVALNHFESRRSSDAKRVEDLMATVTQLTTDVLSMNQKVALIQAQLYEAGVR